MAGGGVGEMALADMILTGAAVGGGASAISGRDPIQGALMGGLLGGVGGAVFGPGAAGAEGAFTASTPTGLAAVPGDAGVAAAKTGIASLMPETLGGKVALGGAGLGALAMMSDQNKYGVPASEKYTGPLSKFQYDPSTYTPYTYRPYAGGGAVEAMSNANAVGANTGFPMADISRGAYATPYQQPISQNVLTGGQDTRVDPYTGQEKFADGGIASLGGYSDGGRLLRGPGDGVSDSIPATIGGRQPARLADGEFVVPARIVSEIGNGSTDAGARELYKMMDRVQSARGKTMGKRKMAKDTNASKYLPA
ncbi:hypothetical protein EBT31_03350 [bacterium]|nr:hypothetical protein [bacterium]